MQELAGLIVNHPNGKSFVIELLNSIASSFFYQTLYAISPQSWESPEEVKGDLKKIIDTFLKTHSSINPSSKDPLSDNDAVSSALLYLLNTFHTRIQERFPSAAIATWIALERREEEFWQFLRDARQDEPAIKIGKALLAFWYYSG